MTPPTLHYDEASDTLSISFTPGEQATGIELTEHILLRINTGERRAVGLTLLEYSLLVHPTDIGPRCFPLSGLSALSPELRDLVLEIAQHPPVSNFLTLSAYTPSLAETIPIISVHPLPAAA
jgi:uncharacterized protein YuzE